MLGEVRKGCKKMISPDAKVDVKQQEIEELVAVSHKFL